MALLEANGQTLLLLKKAVARVEDRLGSFNFHGKPLPLEALAIRTTVVQKWSFEVSGTIPLEHNPMENQQERI